MGWWVAFRVNGAKTFTILTMAGEKKEGTSDWFKNYLHFCHVVDSDTGEPIKITVTSPYFTPSWPQGSSGVINNWHTWLLHLINSAHFWTKPHCVLIYAFITEWRYEPAAPGLMSLLFLFQNVIKHIMFQVFIPWHPFSVLEPHSSAINLSWELEKWSCWPINFIYFRPQSLIKSHFWFRLVPQLPRCFVKRERTTNPSSLQLWAVPCPSTTLSLCKLCDPSFPLGSTPARLCSVRTTQLGFYLV